MTDRLPGLLVSVRSAAEALSALAGGADVIDVKEPSRGSLGRADDAVTSEVLRAVAGRRPVSAALGELSQATACLCTGLTFAKWGLARAGGNWPERFQEAVTRQQRIDPACQPVVVAYADWQRSAAPDPWEVAAFAWRQQTTLLIDTCIKDGTTLLDWLPARELAQMVAGCRNQQTRIALAGSLSIQQIIQMRELAPDWFAVRGAACQGEARLQAIDTRRVQALAKAVLHRGQPAGNLASPA